ncbi:hypothetical protein ACHHYP_04083 [Achlya hypogyna]|uniref:VPS9 domain-containing protein n=1 Tax=Achlya hypogyna TaxID=1202772 RepID=A0A1V9Z278_ACHHY|nr:hypothetical protein ACHHYP_04083 [Achlya hypogyna]
MVFAAAWHETLGTARSSTLTALLSPHHSEMSVSFSSPVPSRADRLAKVARALKKRTNQIEWESRVDFFGGWFRKGPQQGSLRRLRAHAEAALHQRGLAVLQAADDATWETALARDLLYQVLKRQVAWLHAVSDHVKKHFSFTEGFRRRSADDAQRIAGVKAAFADDMQLASTISGLHVLLRANAAPSRHADEPSAVDLAFEMFLVASHFYKSDVGQRVEKTALAALKDVCGHLIPRSAFDALHHDVCSHLAHEHAVPAAHPTLLAVVRRMLCCRLAASYYAPVAAKLMLEQTLYDRSVDKVLRLSLAEIGLIDVGVPHDDIVLTRSIAAIEGLAVLMPDGMLQGYMHTIGVLHDEVGSAMGVASSLCLSADIVLPILVAILAHAHTPLLHLQLHAMEAIGLKDTSIGGESAYYVALLQAAAAAVVAHARNEPAE